MCASPRARAARPCVVLKEPGWNPQTRAALERLIARGAGRGLPVVFDFDNTLVRGDVGEATLAVLVRDGVIDWKRLPASVSPSFLRADGKRVTLADCVDATEYYEEFLAPTAHGERDPTPLANGYTWAVEVMQGLRVADVVNATRKACASAAPAGSGYIDVTPSRTRYPAPEFYPQMVELVATLIRHRFDVWIVSASNVWSVRWMVLEKLNPLLRRRGAKSGLPPHRVVGVSLLLADDRARLFKDSLLVKEETGYATLREWTLKKFTLTSQLHFPVPTYSGKIACIHDVIGQRPYLCAGDSPGDLPMLTFSRHRLWIARLEKVEYQHKARLASRANQPGSWLVQPTRAKSTGFTASLQRGRRMHEAPAELRAATRLLLAWNR